MAEPKDKKPSYEELKAEIDRLTSALAASATQVSEAQKRAAIFQSNEEEVPTGNTVEVTRCKGYKGVGFHDDGREILKPEWHKVVEPTYWYTIDMPPVGGTDIKLNGREFYHGQTYEVTVDELRTLKDVCARLWAHERSIHEDNTEIFRKSYNEKLRKFFPRADAVDGKGRKVIQ